MLTLLCLSFKLSSIMAATKRGKLILFEGIDGSGKTTMSKRLYNFLSDRGIDSVWLREPTNDTEWGRKIRELAATEESIPVEEELNYFVMDRKYDVENNIIPALNSGKNVILDRYFYSNACYQGARDLDIDEILRINREFSPEPDLAILVDVTVETALDRISRNRTEEALLFEQEDYLKKVRKNYHSIDICNLVKVDGNGSEEEVFNSILSLDFISDILSS